MIARDPEAPDHDEQRPVHRKSGDEPGSDRYHRSASGGCPAGAGMNRVSQLLQTLLLLRLPRARGDTAAMGRGNGTEHELEGGPNAPRSAKARRENRAARCRRGQNTA